MSDQQGTQRAPPSDSLRVPGSTTTTQHSTTTTTTTTGGGAPPRTMTTTTGPAAPVITSTVTNSSSSPPRVTRPAIDSWQQPSIRIRRAPSQGILTRPRPNSSEGRPDSAGQTSTPGHTILRKPVRGSAGAELEGSRSRADSTGGGRLRHENRQLEPVVEGNRRRSSSDPTRSWNATHDGTGAPRGGASYMPEVREEGQPAGQTLPIPELEAPTTRRLSAASGMFRFPSFRPGPKDTSPPASTIGDGDDDQYHQDMIDILDTVDPEISTLNTLNNLQNSLFVPDLGRYLNRRPTYNLTRFPTRGTVETVGTVGTAPELPPVEEVGGDADAASIDRTYTLTSLTSRLDDSRFAVLPHGERLHGWTKEERDELNDHVRHLLHSRKEKFKRSMKGFGQYVRKPLGFFVTLYATLITLFGLAWVLFLIGWINVGGRKEYLVNVIDNVLVALFAIMGDGLAPFRAVDTYHMSFIAHYHHLTWRLRRERALPQLKNENDLPNLTLNGQPDVEAACEEKIGELSVLSPEQQKKLVHHQKKFSRSHTFYKPHETETHFAFPLRLLVAVVVLLDCHSCFQIALGACTWGINYKVRPFALTTVILCCSITCNITAGIIISVGDHKTRKKDVLERMFRQELTAQAIQTLAVKREEEKKKRSEEGLLEIKTAESDLIRPPMKEE